MLYPDSPLFACIQVVSKLVCLVMLCLSPVTLLAQESEESRASRMANERWDHRSEIRPYYPSQPPAPLGFGARDREEQKLQNSGDGLGEFPTDTFTAQATKSGNVIAVLKVTITDDDVDVTSNEERTELPRNFPCRETIRIHSIQKPGLCIICRNRPRYTPRCLIYWVA
ncbi:MAG: hypothetical protein F4065_07405 [Rhodothermaceae bacterium]|nr:hypothetical protein [Rhodothermaceae bacterium]